MLCRRTRGSFLAFDETFQRLAKFNLPKKVVNPLDIVSFLVVRLTNENSHIEAQSLSASTPR